jgi:hypothetical protein
MEPLKVAKVLPMNRPSSVSASLEAVGYAAAGAIVGNLLIEGVKLAWTKLFSKAEPVAAPTTTKK